MPMAAADLSYCPRPNVRNVVTLIAGVFVIAGAAIITGGIRHESLSGIEMEFSSPPAPKASIQEQLVEAQQDRVVAEQANAEALAQIASFGSTEVNKQRATQIDNHGTEAERRAAATFDNADDELEQITKETAKQLKSQTHSAEKKLVKETKGPWRQDVTQAHEAKVGKYFKGAAQKQKKLETKAHKRFKGASKRLTKATIVKHGYDTEPHKHAYQKKVVHDNDVFTRPKDLVKESAVKSKKEMIAAEKAAKAKVKAKEAAKKKKKAAKDAAEMEKKAAKKAAEKAKKKEEKAAAAKKKLELEKMPPIIKEPLAARKVIKDQSKIKKMVKEEDEEKMPPIIAQGKIGEPKALVKSVSAHLEATENASSKKALSNVAKKLDQTVSKELKKPVKVTAKANTDATPAKEQAEHKYLKKEEKVVAKAKKHTLAPTEVLLEEFPGTFEAIRKGLRPMKADTDDTVTRLTDPEDKKEEVGRFLTEPTEFGPWLLN